MKKTALLFMVAFTWQETLVQQPFFYKLPVASAMDLPAPHLSVAYEIAGVPYLDSLYLTHNDRIRPGYFPLCGQLSARYDTLGLCKLSLDCDSLQPDEVAKSQAYFPDNQAAYSSLLGFGHFSGSLPDPKQEKTAYHPLPAGAQARPADTNLAAPINPRWCSAGRKEHPAFRAMSQEFHEKLSRLSLSL